MPFRPSLVAAASAVTLTLTAGVLPAVAAPPASEQVADAAVGFLDTAQLDDGGFDVSGFPGFETPDAVLAIAEAGQTGDGWDPDEARAAVLAVTEAGRTPLDALDDLADAGELTAGQAAKLIVLDVVPLGLDPRAFDPSDDSADVDLVAVMDAGRQADGSYGAFNATLFAILAHAVLDRPVPGDTVALVRAGQQENGGWDFAGDRSGEEVDVDTTSYALQALVAAGAGPDDPAVGRALAFLARTQGSDGSWSGFSGPDPSSTALAMLAVTSAGHAVGHPCWRDVAAFDTIGTPYASPAAYLRSLSGEDGAIAEESTFSRVFSTAQGVQGLLRRWLPVERVGPQACERPGYGLVGEDGVQVRGVGPASLTATGAKLVGAAATPDGAGYWAFTADGQVVRVGDAPEVGSLAGVPLAAPIVAGAATPDGRGLWLVGADGGVFSLGSARFHGSTGGIRLNEPVVGMAAVPRGDGYWLVARDGGVFSFGSARFHGSTGGIRLNEPVVGMAAVPQGDGYWLVARDGGVFTFGRAPFRGSLGGQPAGTEVTAMAAGAGGYQLVRADGEVVSFAPTGIGSTGDRPAPGRAVGLVGF